MARNFEASDSVSLTADAVALDVAAAAAPPPPPPRRRARLTRRPVAAVPGLGLPLASLVLTWRFRSPRVASKGHVDGVSHGPHLLGLSSWRGFFDFLLPQHGSGGFLGLMWPKSALRRALGRRREAELARAFLADAAEMAHVGRCRHRWKSSPTRARAVESPPRRCAGCRCWSPSPRTGTSASSARRARRSCRLALQPLAPHSYWRRHFKAADSCCGPVSPAALCTCGRDPRRAAGGERRRPSAAPPRAPAAAARRRGRASRPVRGRGGFARHAGQANAFSVAAHRGTRTTGPGRPAPASDRTRRSRRPGAGCRRAGYLCKALPSRYQRIAYARSQYASRSASARPSDAAFAVGSTRARWKPFVRDDVAASWSAEPLVEDDGFGRSVGARGGAERLLESIDERRVAKRVAAEVDGPDLGAALREGLGRDRLRVLGANEHEELPESSRSANWKSLPRLTDASTDSLPWMPNTSSTSMVPGRARRRRRRLVVALERQVDDALVPRALFLGRQMSSSSESAVRSTTDDERLRVCAGVGAVCGVGASSAKRRKTCLLMHSTATKALAARARSTFAWFLGSARQMISTTRLPTHFCRASSA